MTLTAENLCKRFSREWIFRGLSYSFQPGTYAVIGPNGSGKSTLLQVLWGQMPATSGKVLYQSPGESVLVEGIYQHVSIVAPYVDLIDELTLGELLRFHLSFKRPRKKLSIDELVDRMELGHARNKAVGHFSSGMKQRLKLGLALFSEVSLVFLDEPTMNLDKASVGWYWKAFRELPPETTVFIGSNNESEYPGTATKINILEYKMGYK